MRKIQVAIVTMMLVMVMAVSNLFGCGLVTINSKRDLGQVVATVQIYDDVQPDVIYKKDVVTSFINNYQQQSGASNAELLENIVSSLVNNRVLVQYVKNYYAEKKIQGGFQPEDNWDKWEVTQYLSEDNILEAKYSTYKAVDDYINSFEEHNHDDEKAQDAYTGAVRAVPTGATTEEEITKEKKQKFIDEFKIDDRMNLFVKAVNNLKENDLLGNEYSNNDITKTDYFKKTLTSYYEQELVENLQKEIMVDARKSITYENVKEEYERIYKSQKDLTKTEYDALVEGISASNPLLYGRDGYGMVYHVLLKADTKMSEDLKKLAEEHKYDSPEYNKGRNELFDTIVTEDKRSSWIISGYNFDGQKFTGDYALAENSLPFFGNVTLLNGADKEEKDYKAEYRVDSTTKHSVSQVIDIINDYLYEGTATTTDNRTYTATTVKNDFKQRVRELMFAFSGDDSEQALNIYKGYSVQQAGLAKEFAEAGKELVATNEKTFKVVATDFGYHIMFFSENFSLSNGYNYDALEKFLDKEFTLSEGVSNWEDELDKMLENWDDYENTDNYLYILHGNLASNIASTRFNEFQQTIINEYINNTNFVKIYKDVYSNLFND